MAVTACYEKHGIRCDERFSTHGERTMVVEYRVVTDSATDGPLTVLNGAETASPDQLPKLRTQWTYDVPDSAAVLQRRSCKQSALNRKEWVVECEWSKLPDGSQTQSNENPLQRPPVYWIEHVTYTEVVAEDRHGNPLVNSCGQEFDEPLEQDVSRMVLVAEKNYSSLQEVIDLNLAHANTVNSNTFHGVGPRKALCRPIQCSAQQLENGFVFYRATFRFELKEDTWDRRVVNRGLKHYRSATDTALVTALDDNGQPVSEPVLLKPDGTREADGVAGGPQHILTFETRPISNFQLMYV